MQCPARLYAEEKHQDGKAYSFGHTFTTTHNPLSQFTFFVCPHIHPIHNSLSSSPHTFATIYNPLSLSAHTFIRTHDSLSSSTHTFTTTHNPLSWSAHTYTTTQNPISSSFHMLTTTNKPLSSKHKSQSIFRPVFSFSFSFSFPSILCRFITFARNKSFKRIFIFLN